MDITFLLDNASRMKNYIKQKHSMERKQNAKTKKGKKSQLNYNSEQKNDPNGIEKQKRTIRRIDESAAK